MTASDERAEQQALAAWLIACEQLDRFHITRVADVTGLDSVGMPTWIAVRPDSHTLSVSQGKGSTDAKARISAVMESIEAWHCERVADVLTPTSARASELQVSYHLRDLPGFRPAADSTQRSHQWVAATGLVTGEDAWVPLDYLDLSLSAQERPLRAYTASTNGIAAGIDRDDVVLHALHEVVERHAVSVLADIPTSRRTCLDLQTLPAPIALFVEQLVAAGCWIEITLLPPTMGQVTAVAYLYSESVPVLVAGSCGRRDLGDAVMGALMEAAQSRLALVTGTREDVPSFRVHHLAQPRPITPGGNLVSYVEAAAGVPDDETASATAIEMAELARDVLSATGYEPLVVNLSHPSTGIEVHRVVAPGLSFDMAHNLPRPQWEATEGVAP